MYKFHVFDGSTWTVGRDWNSASTWTWTPPAAGTYSFQVWVRNSGSTSTYDAWSPFSFTAALPGGLTVSSFAADLATPVPAGTPITLTARAVGGTPPYSYRYWVYNGTSWSLLDDWSSSNSVIWVAPAAGAYSFQAWVRNAGSAAPYDAWLGAGPYTATAAAPLAVTTLAADRTFPVPTGTPVSWTARAVGGRGPYTYKFWMFNGASWSVLQDWSASAAFTWVPPAAGSYSLQVWVRNAASAATYDAWRGAPAAVGAAASLSVSSFSLSPTSPLIAVAPATVTATAIGGVGPYTYKFYVFNGTSWTIGRDWAPSNTWTWTPAVSGLFSLQVWIRNAGSLATYDAWAPLASRLVMPSFVATTPELSSISCAEESSQRAAGSVPMQGSVTFVNGRTAPLKLYNINALGQRLLLFTIAPGAYVGFGAGPTQPLVVTTAADQCIAVFLPARYSTHVVIRE